METKIVYMTEEAGRCPAMRNRVRVRTMRDHEWVEKHGSGTLRKNKRLGMTWKSQYIEERTAYEFGWEFECQPRSRIMFGDAFTEGDSSAVTEAGWHIERYITMSVFPEDRFECKYINVEYPDGSKKEGIGIIVRETSASWLTKGNIVFAIVSEFDPEKKEWKHANNPF